MKQHVWVEHKEFQPIFSLYISINDDDRDASAKEHDPKFPCSECGKILTQKSSLRVHVMVRHTGERPFNIPKLPCLECDKMLKVADSEESTESSADEEESDPDECLATNLDKSENRFRGFARLLVVAQTAL